MSIFSGTPFFRSKLSLQDWVNFIKEYLHPQNDFSHKITSLREKYDLSRATANRYCGYINQALNIYLRQRVQILNRDSYLIVPGRFYYKNKTALVAEFAHDNLVLILPYAAAGDTHSWGLPEVVSIRMVTEPALASVLSKLSPAYSDWLHLNPGHDSGWIHYRTAGPIHKEHIASLFRTTIPILRLSHGMKIENLKYPTSYALTVENIRQDPTQYIHILNGVVNLLCRYDFR